MGRFGGILTAAAVLGALVWVVCREIVMVFSPSVCDFRLRIAWRFAFPASFRPARAQNACHLPLRDGLCWETINRKLIREQKARGRKTFTYISGRSAAWSGAVKSVYLQHHFWVLSENSDLRYSWSSFLPPVGLSGCNLGILWMIWIWHKLHISSTLPCTGLRNLT